MLRAATIDIQTLKDHVTLRNHIFTPGRVKRFRKGIKVHLCTWFNIWCFELKEIHVSFLKVKAKNVDLIKASEKQYRLEQELAFYKLDAKFELLGQMPPLHNEQVS